MLLMPIFMSIIIVIVTKIFNFRDDILLTGIIVTWMTFFGTCLLDVFGMNIGWW